MSNWAQKFKRFISSKRGRSLLGIALAFFLLLFLIRGCSDSNEDHGTYHIGLDSQWYSLNLMGKEKNMTAFTTDLLRAIGREQHFNFTLTFAHPNELLNRLTNEQLNAILSAVQPTPTLQRQYVFSEPFFRFGPVLVVHKVSEFDTWEEASHKIIGILSQSASVFEMGHDHSIQLQLYENPLRALSDLDNDRIDGVVLPALQAYVYTQTFYPDEFKIATTPLTQEGYRLIALNNEEGQTLIRLFNEGLNHLRESGEYEKLVEQWGFVNPEQIEASQQR